jgi:hypothetical protein
MCSMYLSSFLEISIDRKIFIYLGYLYILPRVSYLHLPIQHSNSGVHYDGFADYLVSESLYLGGRDRASLNGLEMIMDTS